MKDIDVLNYLEADTAITNIVGTRIWTTWLPEQAAFPAITCNYVSDTPINTITGDTLKAREIVAVNCWARDKVTLNTMINAVKARMNGFAVRQNTVDLNEEEQGIYRFSIDYSIWG